jgi:hypothetical protein
VALWAAVCLIGGVTLAAGFATLPQPDRPPVLGVADSPLSTGAGESRARNGLGHLASKEQALLDLHGLAAGLLSSPHHCRTLGSSRRGHPSRLDRPPIG